MFRFYRLFINNFAYLSVAIIAGILIYETHKESLTFIFLLVISLIFTILQIKQNKLKRSLSNIDEYQISGYNLAISDQFNIEYFDKRFINEYKLKKKSILGKNIFDILNIDSSSIIESINKTDNFNGIIKSIDNDQKHHSIIFDSVKNKGNIKYHCIIHDVTNSIKSDREIKKEYLIDRITGLPSKSKLLSDIDDIIAKPTLKTNVLIYISIDSFDAINEYFGIDTGNKILASVSKWLFTSLPSKNSVLYKLDLENFAILNYEEFSFDSLEDYLKKISSNIEREIFNLKGTDLNIAFTIGATRCKVDMVRCAYLALKDAKSLSRSYKIYDNGCSHEQRFIKNIQMVQLVKNAIAQNRVVPFFQPIYNIKTGKIEKYESLIRIKNSDDTYAKPADFLDVSKKSKLYLELSRSMIENSFEQLEILKFPITLNISIDDIMDSNFSNFIFRKLHSTKNGKFITFEILESERVVNATKITNFIKKVRLMGAKVAIDDFGSGHSNYEQLRILGDVDYLKIDGSLIKDITTDKNSELFTRSIVSVAKEMKIKTIAEFVSSEDILQKVKELGIDYAQGYYIGKPLPYLLPQHQQTSG